MLKHRHQSKASSTSRIGTSISVGPEPQFPSDAGFVPSYEEIQRRAYQIHVEKGGSDLENWLVAERVLKGEKK